MRRQDRHISWLRVRIVERNVLFHGQLQLVLLFVGRGRRILADMLAGNDMVDDAKGTGR